MKPQLKAAAPPHWETPVLQSGAILSFPERSARPAPHATDLSAEARTRLDRLRRRIEAARLTARRTAGAPPSDETAVAGALLDLLAATAKRPMRFRQAGCPTASSDEHWLLALIDAAHHDDRGSLRALINMRLNARSAGPAGSLAGRLAAMYYDDVVDDGALESLGPTQETLKQGGKQ